MNGYREGFRDTDGRRFRLRIAYGRAADAAADEGQRRGYPCAESCAWCCRSVVMINDGDVALIRAAILAMPVAKRRELRARAEAYSRVFSAEARAVIRTHPDVAVRVLGQTWPDGGLACPLLEESEPGRGLCSVYESRPLVCRVHYARGTEPGSGPDSCRPGGENAKPVETLDATPLMQRVITEQELSLSGLLGLEVARILREINDPPEEPAKTESDLGPTDPA
jgi:Fe-S-cluster containining protein